MLNTKKCLANFKKRLWLIFFCIFAIVTALSVTMFCFSDRNKEKLQSADALTSAAAPRIIGGSSPESRLYNPNNSTFNKDFIQSLLNILAYGYNNIGSQEATIANVINAMSSSSYYKYMSGSTLRSKAAADGGISAYIDGSRWQLVYVSQNGNVSTTSNRDVIATFWLDGYRGYSTSMNGSGASIYSQSATRLNTVSKYTLVSTNWDKEYMVQPQDVYWQYSSYCFHGNTCYNNVNDYYGADTNSTGAAWKYDYFWLPSAAEVFNTSYSTSTSNANGSGVWGLTTAQKGTNSSSTLYYWTRTAYNKTSYRTITSKGAIGYSGATTSSRYIRPAVHLNLSKLARKLVTPVNDPKSVTRAYTGYAIDLSKEGWYSGSSAYYNNTSIMSVSPKLNTIKDVKSHTVKFTIAANNSLKCVWANAGGTGTQTVTFTITKVNLTITSFTYNETTKKVTSISSSGAVGKDVPPYAAFRYKYTNSSGGALSNPYVKPTAMGTYRVYPELDTAALNANASLKTFYNNYNVIISPNAYKTIEVKGVTVPKDVTRTYTGSSVVITDAPWYAADEANYGNSSLMSVSPALSTLKNAGTYPVTFTLLPNSGGIVWEDTKTTGSKKINITIKPQTLTVTGFTYDENAKKVTWISTIGQVSGQSPSYTAFKYYYADSAGQRLDKPYVKPIIAGEYRVYPELDQDALDKNPTLKSFYANYDVKLGLTCYHELTVVGIPVPEHVTAVYTGEILSLESENWYSQDNYGPGGQVAFSINCKDVGEYEITFALLNSTMIRWADGTTKDVTITVKIIPRPVYAVVDWDEENEAPVSKFEAIIGDADSGLIEGESIPLIYEYTDASGNLLDAANPNKRPAKKGDYRAYVKVDPNVTPVNYVIDNPDLAYIEFHLEGIPVPKEVKTYYTGKVLDLSSESWYSERYFGADGYVEHTDLNFIDCHTALGKPYYEATFTLKAGADLEWSDGREEQSVSIRIYINPKPIDVQFIQNVETNALTIVPYEGEICERDLAAPPVFDRRYIEFDLDDNVEIAGTETFTEPTWKGLYHVYPLIKTERGTLANYNYAIKDETYCFFYSVLNEVVKTPTITGDANTVTYTGEAIKFELSAESLNIIGDGEHARIRVYEHPSELKRQGVEYREEENAFYIKNSGVYVIQFLLIDPDEFMWDTKGGYLTLTVEKKEIVVSDFTGLEHAQYANTDLDVAFNHNAPAADYDTIAFQLSCQRENEAPFILNMEAVKEDDGSYTNHVSAVLNLNKMGDFTLNVILAPVNISPVNKNYVLSTPFTRNFSLAARPVEIHDGDLTWKYKNSLRPTAEFNKDDASVEYNTREYTAFLDQKNLKECGLKVKSYANETYTRANADGSHNTTTVILTAYDESWTFTDTEFHFDWKITKGLYDLSNIVWDYTKPFSYTGNEQQISLQNLYGGLSAKIEGNVGTDVKEYTATVTFTSLDGNYLTPKEGDHATYRFTGETEDADFEWDKTWKIGKAVITPQWNMHGGSETNTDDVLITYPTLYVLPTKAVRYTFYYEKDGKKGNPIPNGARGLLIVDKKETGYYVEAEIIEGLEEKYEEKYELAEAGRGINFTVGENKTAVKIIYKDTEKHYTGKALPFEFSVALANEDDKADVPAKGNFNITFYNGGELVASNGQVPVRIGVYEVRFEFIDPTVEYYIQGATSFPYTILKASMDPGKLSWNYDSSKPFVFELDEEGNPKSHSVKLSGYNEKAYSVIYRFDRANNIRSESSEIGEYRAEFDIVNLDAENYETIDVEKLPVEFRSLDWRIVPYQIEMPLTAVKVSFDGVYHDLTQLAGLPKDYDRYMTVSMKHNDETIYDVQVMDAGIYTVECTILPVLLEKGRVCWAGNSSMTLMGRVQILPCSIVVSSWTLRTGQTPVPAFVSEPESSFYALEYYFDNELIGENEVKTHFGEQLTVKVIPSPDYKAGNILVSATQQSSVSFDFYLFSKEAKSIVKPKLASAELMYNGKLQQFTVIGFNPTYMEYVGEVNLQLKDLGSGTVTIRLKPNQNVKWQDNTTSDLVLVFSVVCGKITPAWDLSGLPVLSVSDEYLDTIEYVYMDADRNVVEAEDLVYGNSYTVIAKIKDEYIGFFTIDDQNQVQTTFTYHRPGEILYDIPPTTVIDLPVWQVVIAGVSLVLISVFTFMTAIYASAVKRTQQKTDKLKEATLSAAPLLPLVMIRGWLGMGEDGWTAVSLVLLALSLFMLGMMLFYRKKSILATQKYDAELFRIDAAKAALEKQKKEEEAQRRDRELQAMFSGLQSNYNTAAQNMQNMLSGNVQQMIEGTVNAMLPPAPAAQDMQALPSGAPDYSALRDVAAKQQEMISTLTTGDVNYASLAKSYELLCGLTEEVLKEFTTVMLQGEECEELKRVIVRQRGMVDSLMEELKAREKVSASVESDEAAGQQFTLAEAFERLDAKSKLMFNNLSGFIAQRPGMEQVGGKYAILYKYRGKSMFKLNIKDGMPWFSYATDSGTQAEISLEDELSLEEIIQTVALRLKRADFDATAK